MLKKEVVTTYKYTGTNPRGRKIKGEINERSLTLAKSALRKQGITAKSISPKTNLNFIPKRVKPADITVFSRQLATMLKTGIPITKSLELIIETLTNDAVKKLVVDIKNKVESGATFAEAVRSHPTIFDELYYSLTLSGEQSGKLDQMLDKLASHREKSEILKMKVKKALKYPVAVLIVAVIVTVILLVKVIPVFKDLFDSFNGELPAFTQMIVNMSEWLMANWIPVSIGLFVLIYGTITTLRKSIPAQHIVERFSLNLPIFGDIINKSIVARFTSTLETTYGSGVPLTDALESAGRATDNISYQEAVSDIRKDVIEGQQLHFAMKNSYMFPQMAIQLISIGEESGNLEEMLGKVANHYEAEVDNAVDGLTAMMEPLIMAVLGVLVGGLVIAMYLPIFTMGSAM